MENAIFPRQKPKAEPKAEAEAEAPGEREQAGTTPSPALSKKKPICY